MKHGVQVTILLAVLFLCAQLVGLAVISEYIDVPASVAAGKAVWEDLPSVGGVKVERPDVEPSVSIWFILGAVVVGTLLILLIIRLQTILLWKLWFFFAVALCLQIALAAFLPSSVSLALAAFLGFFKVFRPNVYVHNFTELFVYAGLAAIFVPILNVLYAFVLLLALSLYDMYAVWKSKHMIAMAKFQAQSGIFAGLFVPYKRPSLMKGRSVRKESVRTAVLGGGDIGFPMIFSGTVLASSGFGSAVVVSLGATFALVLLLLLGQKDRFYPAMPFLTAGCSIGFLFTLL